MTWRLPAEWEPQDALWLVWPRDETTWPGGRIEGARAAIREVIRHVVPHQEVRLVVHPDLEGDARHALRDLRHVTYLPVEHQDSWIRDYGPLYVVDDAGGRRALKFRFDAWGGKYESLTADDDVVRRLARLPADGDLAVGGGPARRDGDRTGEGQDGPDASAGPDGGTRRAHDEVRRRLGGGGAAAHDGARADNGGDAGPGRQGAADAGPGGGARPADGRDAGAKAEAGHDAAGPGGSGAGGAIGAPVEKVDFVLEGGALETDGQGTFLATESVVAARGQTKAEWERTLHDRLGARKVLWLAEGIQGDDTDGHIDTLTRFVAPRRVVTAVQPDMEHSDHRPLLANLESLQGMTDALGRPLEVLQIPQPDPVATDDGAPLPAGHANFLVTNGCVLLPAYGGTSDKIAAMVLQECFRDRQVVPIPHGDLIWGYGGIHCLSMQRAASP